MENTGANILEVKNLEVRIDGDLILSRLNFQVKRGETLAVIGPNGAGKSVLFRSLLGFIAPTSGSITWQKNIKIGYVPQKLAIEKSLPLSLKEFLEFKNGSHKIKEAIKLTGLKEQALGKKMGGLSGGELQRALIAWAVMDSPDVVLFDEPLAGIDIGGEETIYTLLHKLNEEKNTTVIIISHDLGIVYKYADNVLCVNKKQICLGPPSEVINEESSKKLYGSLISFHNHNHQNI